MIWIRTPMLGLALAASVLALAGCGRIGFDPATPDEPLVITPTRATSNINSRTAFAASGGVTPYTFSIASGSGDIVAATGEVRAPAYRGTSVVRVVDALGDFADAELEVDGEFLYRVGGYDTISHNEVFRSSDGIAWTQVGSLPARRVAGHLFVFDDRMFYIGGSAVPDGDPYDQIFASADGITWATVGTSPLAIAAAGPTVFAGRMWVIGGMRAGDAYLDTVWSSADGTAWTSEPAFPLGVHLPNLISYDRKMWSFSGHEQMGQSDAAFVTSDGRVWTALPATPSPGEYQAGVVFDGAMWQAGGLGLGPRVVSTTDGATWTDAPQLPTEIDHGQLVDLGGALWMIGGEPSTILRLEAGGWAAKGNFPITVRGSQLAVFTPH